MPILASSRLPRTIASFLAVAGVAGAFATGSPASAAPMQTASYDFSQMPDLDQNRNMGVDAAGVSHAGLPGNGDNYCGPTAAIDAFGWLAQHGDPTLSPGVQDWTLAPNYETATSALAQMGMQMRTDPAAGTTQDNFETGLGAWSAAAGNHYYYASLFGDDIDWAPDLAAAAQSMRHGAPVIVRMGYYKPVTRMVKGKTISVLQRNGGHWVVMTGYGPEGITFVDPADTADRMAPSPRTHVVQALQPTTAVYGSLDAAGAPMLHRGWKTDARGNVSFPTATYLQMPGYKDAAGENAYIEGYTVLRPMWTLSVEGADLKYTEGGTIHRWPLPTGNLRDAQVSPAGDVVYFNMAGSRSIWKANVLTGATSRFAVVSAPITRLGMDGDRILAISQTKVTTLSSTGAIVRLPGAVLNAPVVLRSPVAQSAKIDTAVETPSLLTERVIRRAVPTRAKGINAQLGGS